MRSTEPIHVSLYRGGTSKGVFIGLEELSRVGTERDRLCLALLGSPDPMQLDGLGGTHSSTSKLMAIGTAETARALGYEVPQRAELVTLFAQVAVREAVVDWRGNCGNLTAAVGNFAFERDLIRPADGDHETELFNLNTAVRIKARQAVEGGQAVEAGSFRMPGVPGTGARIDLAFHDPQSSVTGRVLPTGRALDELPFEGGVAATLLDVSNPIVLVRAGDLGLQGTESPTQLNADRQLLARIEVLRGQAAERMGIVHRAEDAAATSPAVPRVVLVAPPTPHTLDSGETVSLSDADFVVRTSSMGVIHHAFTGTGLIGVAAAAAIPGTLLEAIGGNHPHEVRLAHPKGVVPLQVVVRAGSEGPEIQSVAVARTARLLMSGLAYPSPTPFDTFTTV